jgi:hypothetical protein
MIVPKLNEELSPRIAYAESYFKRGDKQYDLIAWLASSVRDKAECYNDVAWMGGILCLESEIGESLVSTDGRRLHRLDVRKGFCAKHGLVLQSQMTVKKWNKNQITLAVNTELSDRGSKPLGLNRIYESLNKESRLFTDYKISDFGCGLSQTVYDFYTNDVKIKVGYIEDMCHADCNWDIWLNEGTQWKSVYLESSHSFEFIDYSVLNESSTGFDRETYKALAYAVIMPCELQNTGLSPLE